MVDGTGIIHMNGRIYDAGLGRFLQPDPLVQSPDNAQSWNAYTYVFNNPLAYTDPTGMFSARQFLGFFVAVVMTIVAPQNAGVWYAMATGFASGYVATGTFKGGVIGAFSAGVTFGIANTTGLDNWQRVGLQATTGGIVESLSGGSFGHGFLAAGLTASVMPQVGKIGNDITRTAVGALVGGTLSVATGGKFANGAVSGAIQGAMARQVAAEEEPSKYFEHQTLPSDINQDSYSSPMPEETSKALSKIIRSPMGRVLAAYMDKTGEKIVLQEVEVIADAFYVGGDGNYLTYTRNVPAYVNEIVSSGRKLDGDQLETATLDALIMHEIGHTNVGSAAFGMTPIPVLVGNPHARRLRVMEEFRAVKYYENPYRQSMGLPARCSYFTEGDICK